MQPLSLQSNFLRFTKFFCVSCALIAKLSFAAPGDIIYEEEFDNLTDVNNDWSVSGSGIAFLTSATFNVGPLSLALGENTITISSNSGVIDTSGLPAADLDVWVQRGSDLIIENPDAGEDLTLEYFNSSGAWIELETYAGDGTQGEIFTPTFTLPSDGRHANFRLRFTLATGSGSNFDYWHIDSVTITERAAPTVPAPIAEYRLDESIWNGGSNEIIDSTGNGLDGSAINLNGFPSPDNTNPVVSGTPGTCGYGTFNGTGDGYLQIDDPGTGSILDLPTNFSVAVWIYPTSLPGSGLRTIVSKDENFEFHINSSGQVFWWWGGGVRQLTSSSSVTLNTWNHIAITYESGSQIIYINGSSVGTNNSTTAITTNNDDLFIGTDLNFHSRRFDGFIDEVKIYDVTLSQAQVEVVRDETHDCTNSVDYFAISHSGTGVTCEAENVTITARDSSDIGVDNGGNTIRVTATSTTPGWVASDAAWTLVTGTGSFSTPSAAVAEYTFGTGESSVVLALANISEADIDIDVVDTANSSLTDREGSATDPILSFSNTGFRFYNDANSDGDADGTDPIASPITAGVTSGQMILRGVQTNTDTGQCEARLSGAQTVSMAYECVNPTTCVRNQDLEINGVAVEENDLGATIIYSPVSLTFDADGEAPFSIEYFDAGAVRLQAELTLAASGSDPAITLTGTSANTVSVPADLVITEVLDSGGGNNPGTTTAGAGFVSSDTPFTVVVQALNDDGGLTPNFGNEIAGEGLTLSVQSLVMPAGGILPALTSPNLFSSTGTAGEFENTVVRWSEAGTITMRAEIADGDYLGAGNVLGTTSGNVGRFYPARYDIGVSAVSEECVAGSFTYMSDQSFVHRPLDISFTVTAQSTLGSTTSNYDASLAYPVGGFNAVAENNNDGIDLSSRAFIASATWVSGAYSISGTDNAGFSRSLSGVNEVVDGPYSLLQIGVSVDGSDLDSVNFATSDLSMHPGQSNDCISDNDCTAAALSGTVNMLFGRLYGLSAHGPESAPLAVTLQTQYWDGSEFITNNADACTTIDMTEIQFDGSTLSIDANRTVTVGSGTSTGSFDSFVAGTSMTLVSGDAGLEFTAPGVGNSGSFDVDIDLTNYPWLRNDWDNDGDYSDDSALPSLEIFFGRYRGHDRIIYWQEVLN